MFQAFCKLGLEGIVSKKLDAPYKSGPIKGVVENQKSKRASSNSRRRRHLLRGFPPFSVILCLAAYGPKFLWDAKIRAALDPKESAAPISPRPCTPEVGANIPTKNYDFG
jgi:hypothetical protein